MKRLVIALFAVALLSACASRGSKFQMADVEAFVPGVTTYSEVSAKLGKPTSTTYGPDGAVAYTWIYSAANPAFVESRSAIIVFDKYGKMIRLAHKYEQ